eukprot:266169_1
MPSTLPIIVDGFVERLMDAIWALMHCWSEVPDIVFPAMSTGIVHPAVTIWLICPPAVTQSRLASEAAMCEIGESAMAGGILRVLMNVTANHVMKDKRASLVC